MKSFDKEIKQFLVDGVFNNNLDDAGNINLSLDPIDVNERYIQFELSNYLYDAQKISTLYDVEIKEFTIPKPPSQSVSGGLNSIQISQENELLRSQLNNIINADSQNSASAIADASKDIIIQLRIKLNEGNTVEDFSDAFPYLKK
jgi:hypothetical protein